MNTGDIMALNDEYYTRLANKQTYEPTYKKPFEKKYSKDEVVKLIRKAFLAARMKNKAIDKVSYSGITGQKRKYTFTDDNWIKENLK